MAPAVAPTGDALIDELNAALGKTGEPTPVDGPQQQPTPLADQLRADAPAPAPRAAAPATRASLADKQHAVAHGGFGYKVLVAGEYYAKSQDTKGNVIKKYELPFNLPALIDSKGHAALGIIVGKLLKSALQKHDPTAVTYRTHEIVSVTPLNGAPEPASLQYMSFEALKKHVKDRLVDEGFPVDPEEYWDASHLREDVIDFITNRTGDVVFERGTLSEKTVKGGFGVKKTPADRIKERHAERVEDRALQEMN